jgi:hypothetical protein
MKKRICLLILLCSGLSLHAFDSSLKGSWGLVKDGEKKEVIQLNNDGILLFDTLFRSDDYSEADNTIYISDFDDDSIILQYYRLASNKLLFILWNTDDPTQSITLILTKL